MGEQDNLGKFNATPGQVKEVADYLGKDPEDVTEQDINDAAAYAAEEAEQSKTSGK